ncbi:hypothetical protein M8H82_36220 [Streptomyces sp. YS415]|nr:hypothetical protein [Streptomyces sp. YS415]
MAEGDAEESGEVVVVVFGVRLGVPGGGGRFLGLAGEGDVLLVAGRRGQGRGVGDGEVEVVAGWGAVAGVVELLDALVELLPGVCEVLGGDVAGVGDVQVKGDVGVGLVVVGEAADFEVGVGGGVGGLFVEGVGGGVEDGQGVVMVGGCGGVA